MTRLVEYIEKKETDFDIFNQVYENANLYFWKTMQKAKRFMYRGSERSIDTFEVIPRNVNKARNPVSMPYAYHTIFNELFKKKFGWYVRNGAFAISDWEFTRMFGEIYIFIPMGNKLQYVWSPYIQDLNFYIQKLNDGILDRAMAIASKEFDFVFECLRDIEDDERKLRIVFKVIVDMYQDHDLLGAFKKEHEVIFNCSEYMLVNGDYTEGFI